MAIIALPMLAQTTDWQRKYDSLVGIVGVSGVGVESLLNNWEKEQPECMEMLVAKFQYYNLKSQYQQVVTKDTKKFLGQDCLMELKDSLGSSVYYFQETFYDDSLAALSFKYVDKAIALNPKRLDLRVSKITSMISYEKGSPDMAWSELSALIDEHWTKHPAWEYPGETIVEELFVSMVQEYGYNFFKTDTPQSLSAFLKLSEKMSAHYPSNMDFVNDIGSYYVMNKDYKTAFKYYNKVLKEEPSNHNAILNCVNIAIRQNDKKLLKKYLPLMAQYGNEVEQAQAKARLKAL